MPFFRQCSENDLRSTHSTREAKIRSFCMQTLSLEPWKSRHFGLLSRPGLVVQRVFFVWRAASAGGLRDDTAAGNVASLTFTRKCLLHGASDCGCGNGFLFSRRPRPVSQSFQSALAWFQSALAWFRLLRASDCRCGNGFL